MLKVCFSLKSFEMAYMTWLLSNAKYLTSLLLHKSIYIGWDGVASWTWTIIPKCIYELGPESSVLPYPSSFHVFEIVLHQCDLLYSLFLTLPYFHRTWVVVNILVWHCTISGFWLNRVKESITPSKTRFLSFILWDSIPHLVILRSWRCILPLDVSSQPST